MAKTSIYARFATDQSKEEQGVWVDFGDGIRFRIRRLKSKASADVRNELNKPYLEQQRRGSLSQELQDQLLLKQIAYGIISDWEGVENADGQPIPYNRDNALQLMTDLPDLRDEIFAVSLDREAYKNAIEVDTAKN